MSNTTIPQHQAGPHDAQSGLRQFVIPLLITYALVPLSFLFPNIDPTHESYFRLDTWFALCANGVTATGDVLGASLTGVLLLVILITRAGLSARRRLLEAGVVLGFLFLLAGGGAALNENVIKHALKLPRPNFVYLAGDGGSGPLQMPVHEFYALEEKARRAHLRTVLEASPPPVALRGPIREHWITTIGYSFPSGHSFTAMFFATFFLGIGLRLLSGPRRSFFYLLLPWALCVCYSRVILWVHNPRDVVAGSFMGLLFGWLGFRLVHASLTALRRRASQRAA